MNYAAYTAPIYDAYPANPIPFQTFICTYKMIDVILGDAHWWHHPKHILLSTAKPNQEVLVLH
jgi:hypothetical protein